MRNEPVERKSGANKGFHLVARGQGCDCARLIRQQSGGVADVQVACVKSRGTDAFERLLHARELGFGDQFVRLVCREEVCHDAFQP